VSVNLSDETAEVTVTLFNEPIRQLLGFSCNDLVTNQGYIKELEIPPPLHQLIGKAHIFQLKLQTRLTGSATYFTCNYAAQLEPSTQVAPETLSSGSLSTPPVGIKTPAATTEKAGKRSTTTKTGN
jgi:hypothetical protein